MRSERVATRSSSAIATSRPSRSARGSAGARRRPRRARSASSAPAVRRGAGSKPRSPSSSSCALGLLVEIDAAPRPEPVPGDVAHQRADPHLPVETAAGGQDDLALDPHELGQARVRLLHLGRDRLPSPFGRRRHPREDEEQDGAEVQEVDVDRAGAFTREQHQADGQRNGTGRRQPSHRQERAPHAGVPPGTSRGRSSGFSSGLSIDTQVIAQSDQRIDRLLLRVDVDLVLAELGALEQRRELGDRLLADPQLQQNTPQILEGSLRGSARQARGRPGSSPYAHTRRSPPCADRLRRAGRRASRRASPSARTRASGP